MTECLVCQAVAWMDDAQQAAEIRRLNRVLSERISQAAENAVLRARVADLERIVERLNRERINHQRKRDLR